jgi:hypothetical protein
MRFLVCLFRAIGVRLTLSVRLLVVALICIGFLVDVLGRVASRVWLPGAVKF